MMSDEQPTPQRPAPPAENAASATAPVAGGGMATRGCGFYAALAGVLVLALALIAGGWYWYHFHARPFPPVELNASEQQVLDEKVKVLSGGEGALVEAGELRPVLPDEDEQRRLSALGRARRTVTISERELNAMLHHNTGLGDRLKIGFFHGGIGAEAHWPVEEEVPVIGGKTIRAKVLFAAHTHPEGSIVMEIKEVTVGGVPLPNAWLGGIKGKNLAELQRADEGPLGFVSAGIEEINVSDGELRIVLKE